jgi:hypothetical protein
MSTAEDTSVPEHRHAGTAEAKAFAQALLQQGLRLLGAGARRLWPWRRHPEKANMSAAGRDAHGRNRRPDTRARHRQ